MLIDVPTVISFPFAVRLQRVKRRRLHQPNHVRRGIYWRQFGWCEVRVCRNSTVSSASARAPMGISLGHKNSFQKK